MRRTIFQRPFCDDFLKFCFQNFVVGVWSSRSKIIERVVDYLMGDQKDELLFCWALRGKFSEAQGRKPFQQLIDGVTYCHNKDVYHRDLKLENVLIDESGLIKITDFGLSAFLQHFRDDG